MRKKQKNLKLKILFNASVVLSGLYSPKGGSARLLSLVQNKKIHGIISETIYDEILRHSEKINIAENLLSKKVINIFKNIFPAPFQKNVDKYNTVVVDEGDSHVLATAKESKSSILVTLDKKHLLILKNKIKDLEILTPKELIEKL